MTPSEFTNSSSETSADNIKAEVSSSNEELKTLAKKLRRHIITMIGKAGSGHPGGSLSSVEIVLH